MNVSKHTTKSKLIELILTFFFEVFSAVLAHVIQLLHSNLLTGAGNILCSLYNYLSIRS